MATYRHDPDLEFLRHCHRDDLDLLVSVLICPKDGEARITEYSFNHGDDRDGKVKRVLETSLNNYTNAMYGNDSNLLIVFYVQIMPDDLVMQLHRF